MKESDLIKCILDYLAANKIFHWRHSVGAFMRDGHFYRFGGRKGASDIFILKGGKLYAVELKVGKNKLSLEQMEFLADIERNGGVAIVARNLEDVEEKLK